MKISIIIPVYKVEDYLDRCVQSVVNQTYRDLEIILVDDGSPDRCPEMCDEWAKKDNRIKVVHKKNGGLSSARNAGIDAATGEYIYFLDSDDWISNDCIEKLAEPLRQKEYDFVVGDIVMEGDKTSPRSEDKWLKMDGGQLEGNSLIVDSLATGGLYPMACNKLCKASFIKKNDLYFKEGLINEDEPWSFRMVAVALKMFVVKAPTYYYFIRENSIMDTIDKEAVERRYNSLLYIVGDMYLTQKKHKLYTEHVDRKIRSIINSAELHARKCGMFSSWKYYKAIRKADCRSIEQKKILYASTADRIRRLDVFMPVPMGFIYRWIYRIVVVLRTCSKDSPFII